jgi:DNA polymerase-3 subunit epsilon
MTLTTDSKQADSAEHRSALPNRMQDAIDEAMGITGSMETERTERDQEDAALRARTALAKNIVVFDTETTGLGPDAEIVEISCVDGQGRVLFDTMVRPRVPMEYGAQLVNGIDPIQLVSKPTMDHVMDRLEPVLAGADVIASYNLDFDHRMLRQSVGPRYRLPLSAERLCVMEAYAAWRGEWNMRFESYRWHSLAHALEDCGARPQSLPHGSLQNALGSLAVLRHMAGGTG